MHRMAVVLSLLYISTRAVAEPSCYIGAYRSVNGPWNACAGYKDCEAGSYCIAGEKHPCPGGSYGSSSGLSTNRYFVLCYQLPRECHNDVCHTPQLFRDLSRRPLLPPGDSGPHSVWELLSVLPGGVGRPRTNSDRALRHRQRRL